MQKDVKANTVADTTIIEANAVLKGDLDARSGCYRVSQR